MLSEKQQKCVLLMVTTNKTQKQIASDIQVAEGTITEWKKQEEFKSEMQKQIRDNFNSLAVKAQKELGKLLNSKNEYIRIQAVKEVLDRAGYKATEKIDMTGSINSPSSILLESISRQLSGGANE